MKYYIFSFTENGKKLATILCDRLVNEGDSAWTYSGMRDDLQENAADIKDVIFNIFKGASGDRCLIFVGATGIAVRYIAPYVTDKKTDPAVVSVDDRGNYVVSLLSGHLGGANEIAEHVAKIIDAMPVISTATDINGAFSVDTFAKRNKLKISDMTLAKRISAKALKKQDIGIIISPSIKESAFDEALYLIPRTVILGIGCRKNIDPDILREHVLDWLLEYKIHKEAVCKIVSIDLKKNEEALIKLSNYLNVPFETYSSEELLEAEGEFSGSEFVEQTTGVDNVCERAIVCAGGVVAYKKRAGNGITLAVGEKVYDKEYYVNRNEGIRCSDLNYVNQDCSLHNVLIFGGTYEGRVLVERLLRETKVNITACTATEYGGSLLPEAGERLRILSKRLDQNQMSQIMKEKAYEYVIDATHPYATEVSVNITNAARENNIPYFRIVRPSNTYESRDNIIYVDSVNAATDFLKNTSGNILSTIGSKELSLFCQINDFESRVYARILSSPEMVKKAYDMGFKGTHLICMQGPFTKEIDKALIDAYDIKYVVTKDTGDAGGFMEKLEACRECMATLVVVNRSIEEEGYSLEECIEIICNRNRPRGL